MRVALLIAIIADVAASQLIADTLQYAGFLLLMLFLYGVFAVSRRLYRDRFH